MSDLRIKQLSVRNWLEPDAAVKFFVGASADGCTHELVGADWLEEVLDPKVEQQVPQEIRELFEVARGAMAYAYFFYPLYTLALEQLLRVADAAVLHRCRSTTHPQLLCHVP